MVVRRRGKRVSQGQSDEVASRREGLFAMMIMMQARRDAAICQAKATHPVLSLLYKVVPPPAYMRVCVVGRVVQNEIGNVACGGIHDDGR